MVPIEGSMMVATEESCAADEAKVLCIIRDMTNTVTQTKFTLNLPVSTPVKVFTEEVAKQLGYVADSFNIIYERCQDGDTSEVNVKVFEDQAMGDMCLFDGGRKRNNFTIMDKDDQQPVRVECKATDSSYDLDKFSVRSENQYTSSSSNYTSSYGGHNYSHVSPIMISETGYVGLVNQAMTCYLSSLLQTLYMTPEFRNAVYRWEYDGTPEEAVKSIPYQLQRLFLQLQTSKKRAIETTDITKSFGWESSEAWQQHDVQELCRVMFDALEKKWKKTDQANLINRLYQGHLKDYVKCLKCGKESARTDAYLDIPLVIRPFGSETAYQSVNEALNAFVEPEILNGCNQYFCDHCNLKCDAHKGLKFISFPYILTLQLKRFDFDYVTMHRIKLNDCVEFPEILNLNHLIEDPQTDSTEKKSGAASDSCEHSDEGIGDEVEMGCSASGSASEETDDSTSISASDAEAATNDRNALHSKQAGPYEYELFSIMIHSGSAAGGHYYAYIKSFIDGRWYSFNDQHVSAITNDDIKKTHGGSNFSKGSYFSPSAYTSSTNAYMLMYRQIDKAKNKEPLKVEDFPEHLKQALSSVNEQAETERRQRELERCTCRIRVYFHNPFLDRMLDTKLEIHRDQTLSDAVEMAWKHFEMDKKFSRDCVRLVKYEEALDYIDHSWEGHDDDPMGSLLGGVKTLYSFDLLMEVKNPQEEFEEYKSGGVTVKVYNVDIVKWEVSAALTIRAYHSQTMAEFRQMVADKFGGQLDPDKMRCVRERYNELKLLGDRTIKQEGFIKSNKVFVECSGSEDDSMVIFSDTAFHRLLSQYQNTICLRISLPSTSPDESGLSSSKSTPSPIGTPSKCSEQQDDMDEGIVDLAAGDFAAEPSSGAPSSPEGHENVRSSCLQSGQQASVLNAVSDAIYKQYLRNSNPSETETETEGVVSEEPAPSTTTSATTWNNDVDWCVEEDAAGGEERNEESRSRFYQADLKVNPENNEKELRLRVDKRTLFRQLKKYLEPFVGTTSEFFKVYKIYSNNQDIEITYLSESLNSYSDDCRLVVRLGRALKKGEHRIKIHQLAVNSEEPSKFMCEVIIARGMSVLEAKVAIAAELRQQCQLEVPIDRMRLRKKAWKNPGTIFKDTQLFEEDITIMSSSEIFFEILDGPECVLQSTQLSLYIRRWRPSQHKLDPMQEIVLDDSHSVEGLKRKICEASGVPVEDLEFAKARGTFPYEMSVLDIPTELDWNPQVTSLNMWPMSLCDDGLLVFFRDKTEELGELADEKKKEIQQEENVRLAKYTSKSLYSPRKERALKIYTDDTPSPDASNTRPSFLMEPL